MKTIYRKCWLSPCLSVKLLYLRVNIQTYVNMAKQYVENLFEPVLDIITCSASPVFTNPCHLGITWIPIASQSIIHNSVVLLQSNESCMVFMCDSSIELDVIDVARCSYRKISLYDWLKLINWANVWLALWRWVQWMSYPCTVHWCWLTVVAHLCGLKCFCVSVEIWAVQHQDTLITDGFR